jgi:hypothetical protein
MYVEISAAGLGRIDSPIRDFAHEYSNLNNKREPSYIFMTCCPKFADTRQREVSDRALADCAVELVLTWPVLAL